MTGKVLVTGAGGFIGSHLVETLVREGWDVRAQVHYNSLGGWGWLDDIAPDLLASVEVVAGDIRDPWAVAQAVRGRDTVMHLAALIGIPYSYVAPAQYVETNVMGTLNVLQAARDAGVSRIVQTSTSEVYGTAQYVPIDERHPLAAQSPYAASKIGADQLALSYHRSFGTPVSVIRPFNTYGPRQSARAVIPAIINQLLAGATSIRLGSLTPTRDFNFVEDTARGFIAVARSEGAIGEVVNIGSNFEVSIGATLDIIAEVVGQPVEVILDEQRVRPAGSEVERLWADNAKAIRLTGWRPRYGGADGFRLGIERTVDWFRTAAERRPGRARSYAV
ncbi:NAD-dependent dehydratase [Skermanella stibiiresistens SB22]|uniref:NAD-dependent dehydratase n=1 Tax=Skermanella stibiiresistens SB22 TaxID=1385369 RepID=W9H8W9_9PROT|nr:NAD-dependent 4,6-dehydratase LegB [Skermanella stibiiresistens]EWY42509.1 NAD-dependent dehydratase [Skermanella stibiiresistens SB22]